MDERKPIDNSTGGRIDKQNSSASSEEETRESARTGTTGVEEFDEPKLEALVEMMVLAAGADGDFSAGERRRLEKNIVTLTSRRVQGDRLAGLLAELESRIDSEGRAARLVAVKHSLGDLGSRKVALELAISVMAADGIVRTSERELIMETAEALEIDPDEAADMVRAVEGDQTVAP